MRKTESLSGNPCGVPMAVAACKDQEASLKDGAFKARHYSSFRLILSQLPDYEWSSVERSPGVQVVGVTVEHISFLVKH